MNRDEAEQLCQRWADAVSRGDAAAWTRLLTEDVRDLSAGTSGSESFMQRVAAVRQAFESCEVTVEALVVNDSELAWRWTLKGQKKDGSSAQLRGANFQRVRDGRVCEHWTIAGPG